MNTSTMNATTTFTHRRMIWNFAPWLSRIVMLPPIVIFTLIGIRFLTNPAHATPGVTLNTPEAFTDTRVLGAWMVTMVLMLIVFLLSENRLWLGNLQLAVFMGATLAVRIFGFANDGTSLAMGNQRTITIVETVFLVLNTLGFFVQTRLFRNPR
ncbi:MAG TPA: hypothetical protein VF011_04015 [Terriglobales bacterium]